MMPSTMMVPMPSPPPPIGMPKPPPGMPPPNGPPPPRSSSMLSLRRKSSQRISDFLRPVLDHRVSNCGRPTTAHNPLIHRVNRQFLPSADKPNLNHNGP